MSDKFKNKLNWTVRYKDNVIEVRNRWRSCGLYINGQEEVLKEGIAFATIMEGTLPSGEKVIAVVNSAYSSILCSIYVDYERVFKSGVESHRTGMPRTPSSADPEKRWVAGHDDDVIVVERVNKELILFINGKEADSQGGPAGCRMFGKTSSGKTVTANVYSVGYNFKNTFCSVYVNGEEIFYGR